MPFPDHPAFALAGLGLALLLSGLAWWAERRRRARLARYAEADLLARLAPRAALAAARRRTWRLAMVAVLAGVAFAGPRWGREKTAARREGVDVELAVDDTLSMLAEDERPSRLARVKQEIRRLRATGPGDRYALLAFAGRSYVLTPLTSDGGAIELFLDNLDPSVVGQAGSALAPALRQGRELLTANRGAGDRALVVFADGEAWDEPEGILREAAALAEAQVQVVTVGVGTTAGTTIPLPGGQVKRDVSGEPVVTRYMPALLAQVAARAGGAFVPAEAPDKAARVRRELSRLRTARRTIEETAHQVPRFAWFLWPALAFLLADTFAGLRRRRAPTAPAVPAGPASAAAAAAAALLGTALALGAPWPARATQDPGADFKAGRYPDAIRRWRTAVQEGDRRPATLYNLGTALLAADSLGAAIDVLEGVTRGAPPGVRERALYNLGLAHLRRARGSGDSAAAAARQAAQAYKQVLLGNPRDDDARWNYELALRNQPPEQASSPRDEDGGTARPEPSPQGEPSGGLSAAQARQLLDNAARDERDTQERRQKRARPDAPPQGKDW
ncbi:MAG: VWA domain-containing protein [Gemmatimonadota bacterium]